MKSLSNVPVVNFAGRTNIGELIALLRKAKIVVSNDDQFLVDRLVDADPAIEALVVDILALEKIYAGNFARYAGTTPRALDVEKAIAFSERTAATAEAISGTPAAETEAALVAKKLAG